MSGFQPFNAKSSSPPPSGTIPRIRRQRHTPGPQNHTSVPNGNTTTPRRQQRRRRVTEPENVQSNANITSSMNNLNLGTPPVGSVRSRRRYGRRVMPMSNVTMPNGDVAKTTIMFPKDCECQVPAETTKIVLRPDGKLSAREYQLVKTQMDTTIVQHSDNMGGVFTSYEIIEISKLKNCCLWKRYKNSKLEIGVIGGDDEIDTLERILFHGTPNAEDIISKGFNSPFPTDTHGGCWGPGVYFAAHSSKSNQYVNGYGSSACAAHGDSSCYTCERQLLLCRVFLGRTARLTDPEIMYNPPPGFNSVEGVPSAGGLKYPEYIVYMGEQIYPEYVVKYKIVQ